MDKYCCVLSIFFCNKKIFIGNGYIFLVKEYNAGILAILIMGFLTQYFINNKKKYNKVKL
jgi:hypothetical protein